MEAGRLGFCVEFQPCRARIPVARLADAAVAAALLARVADQPIAELLADADRALYRAKRAGRDRVVAA